MIQISNKTYEVFVDHKNGWRPEAFRERYSEVLDRYDYIVGDWGYSQLRLRGFFKDNHPKATKDTVISTIEDYLNEYCNFGCAYFILEKTGTREIPPSEQGGDEEGAAQEEGEPAQDAGEQQSVPAGQERREQAPTRHNTHAARAETKQEHARSSSPGGGRNHGRGQQQESSGKQGGSHQGTSKPQSGSHFRGKDGKPGASKGPNAQGSPRNDR
ncbi:YutD family protein, partial [Paenibacillus validus]|uniref:YutD family protein n=2 Tax=Paenibacillus TaxID=44249 RepID=UPI002E1C3E81|nr:YutD family protein [Paenibacillus validus]